MNMTNEGGLLFQGLLGILFLLAIFLYLVGAVRSARRFRRWPLSRIALWTGGVLCAAVSLIGPLANRAHMDFNAHMVGHLLLGMLAPLLIALSAPMTLLLRTLHPNHARQVTRVLRSRPVHVISHPVTAAFLNIGGLWLLYTTGLYAAMHHSLVLNILVHLHIFLASYLFTISIIYIDPSPHRVSFSYRAIVLVMALAGHDILTKYIYAYPPDGVSAAQAETGGMLMYYGGDAIDLVLIIIFCFQWFKAERPRAAEA